MALANYSDFKFEDHPSILDASRVIIERGKQPYRIVVRKNSETEYVTHQESVVLDGDTWRHGSFYWGHYFHVTTDKESALALAMKDFVERISKM